jgi:putative transposase
MSLRTLSRSYLLTIFAQIRFTERHLSRRRINRVYALREKGWRCTSVGRGDAPSTRRLRSWGQMPAGRWIIVHDQFASGRRLRVLNIVDDGTRERLAAIAVVLCTTARNNRFGRSNSERERIRSIAVTESKAAIYSHLERRLPLVRLWLTQSSGSDRCPERTGWAGSLCGNERHRPTSGNTRTHYRQ